MSSNIDTAITTAH